MKKLLSLIVFALFSFMVSAQVSQTVNVATPGTLATLASAYLSTVTNLTVTGNIDARDVKTMRDNMPVLAVLDMGGVSIKAFTGVATLPSYTIFPSNEMPTYSFYNWDKGIINNTLKNIVLPNSLKSIGESAFARCSGIIEILIPNSITSIGAGAFMYCTNLIDFRVNIDNSFYSIVDGVLFSKNGSTLILYPSGKQADYIIPNNVTSIEDFAFKTTRVLNITIPSSVTSIGIYTFSGCNELISVSIPNTITTISEGMFSSCSSLTNVNIGTGVTTIGEYAFSSCSSLKNINLQSSVLTIGTRAFSDCIGLLSISIPNSVTQINEGVFSKCSSLADVNLGNSVESIGFDAFNSCYSLKNIIIPISVNSIGLQSFADCSALNSVVFYEGISTIGNNAFNQCRSLTEIMLPNSLNSIGDGAFYLCTSLKKVSFGNSLKTIGNAVFYNCSNLSSIIIPNTVTSIGTNSFNSCTKLKTIYSLNTSPPTLGGNSFLNVLPIAVYVPALSVPLYKAAANWSTLNIITEKRVTINVPTEGSMAAAIINGGFGPLSSITHLIVTGNINSIDISQMKINLTALTSIDLSEAKLASNAIPNNAFQSKTSLTSVTLPANLLSIGDYAFDGCSSLNGDIPLPASVTSVGAYAYQNCTSLTSALTIPSELTTIGSYAFKGCTGFLGTIIIPNSVTSIGANAFQNCSGFTDALIIGSGVISIGNYAFDGCRLSGDLTIPNNVTSIGSYAFQNCSGFTGTLTLSNVITTVPTSAFSGCSGLTGTLTLPSTIISLGTSAFSGCSGFTGTLTLPSISTVPSSTFSNCSGFTGTLTLPSTITSLGTSAFSGCSGFTGSLTLPNAITTVPSSAFSGCSGFTGVLTIPLSVTSIAASAFNGCSKLTQLNFSKTATTTIADNAFNGCTSLTKISIPRATPPTIYTNTFNGVVKESCTLEVPTGSSLSYQIANFWSQFIFVTESSMAETYGITLQIGANGSVKENNVTLGNGSVLTAAVGSTKTFTFTPNAGYAVATVTYGGVDVTSQLINNQYTTAAINANATLNVTFSKVQYSLSIKDASTGSVNLLCDYGATYNFNFTPTAGWKVSTVFYNNVDVTASLVNGVYTVPSITANGLLNVAFVSTATGVPEFTSKIVKVFSTQSEIIIEGTSSGEAIQLYSLEGKLIEKQISVGERMAIPAQRDVVYLVKTVGKTFKVML